MPINRRSFLKVAGASVGGLLVNASNASAKTEGTVSTDDQANGMLYDATICIGCRACQVACKAKNNLPAEKDPQSLYEMPTQLSANTYTVIKLYRGQAADDFSFVKAQCMNCLDPACVSVCPVAALQKEPNGPVTYDTQKCIGCRYCMAACPFDIPKYQWDKTTPLIRKCNFCADLQAKGQPTACAAACPTGALLFGKRSSLIEIAEKRVQDNPTRYAAGLYGKDEAGGTSVLYLSHVPFDKLGLPTNLPRRALPKITQPYMVAGVPGIILVVGSLMSGIYWFNNRKESVKEEQHGHLS